MTSRSAQPLRVLLINFELDTQSKVLAWQHSVARELAAGCERLVVMTESGNGDGLPSNVTVHRVPLLLQRAPLRWLGGRWLMLLPCVSWVIRERFDVCFIHMNMSWACRLGLLLRVARIPVLLWYAHGSVSRMLKCAHSWAARVITSTPEGFRLSSTKKVVIGQGVDTELFRIPPATSRASDVIYVGRLSERKRVDLVIETFGCMRRRSAFEGSRLLLVGTALTRDDEKYSKALAEKVRTLGLTDCVEFRGHVPLAAIPELYSGVALHLNLSETGSMDKTVLESLACGCPVLTSNSVFRELFGLDLAPLFADDTSPAALADRAQSIVELRESTCAPERLRALVVGKHDLRSFSARVLAHMHELAGDLPAP
jgi:glycosyltransferase involved in cell wall biosynthesis